MQFDRSEPGAGNRFQSTSAELILSSHLRLLRRPLLPEGNHGSQGGWQLYHAPIVVMAHDTAADPVFFYANLAAQRLFEMSWTQMVGMPSRRSAEPAAREDRQRLLDRVARQGYIDDYAGVRIAASGTRFRIRAATVFNLIDEGGETVGQAAAFAEWSSAPGAAGTGPQA